ncbi:MAG: site-2 protease family protein [Micrococcales bacterium]|nr:site-2 protease family protein [Micrococcales bacterium]
MIAFIVGVLVIVVGVAFSIGLHELGHLFFAKRFGVRVGQWMIGFGPTLFSRKLGETEYGVKAIPLGGYISMAGMYPPSKQERAATAAGRHEDGDPVRPGDAAPHSRAATTGFFNALVQDVPDDPSLRRLEHEDQRVFYRLSPWKRIVIMLGGPAMNLLIGLVCAVIVLMGFGILQPSLTVGSVSRCVVPQTAAGQGQSCDGRAPSPAAAAGIRPGDRIVSVAGSPASSWDQATAIIRRSDGKSIPVTVERDGARRTLDVTPITNTVAVTDAFGQPVKDGSGTVVTQRVGFVGMGSEYSIQQQPVTAVVPYVWANVTGVGNIILNFPQRIVQVAQAAFGGQDRDPNGPISVVGVGRLAGEVAAADQAPIASRAASLISIVGSVNIALFVFNLVPLLPLDGGHVLGALWEALRRRLAKLIRRPDPGPVDISKAIPVTLVVTGVLGVTSALLIYADIVNPIRLF